MSWTTPETIRAQVRKLWDSGRILASLAGGEPVFPRRLSLKKPTSAEMGRSFSEVREWIGKLQGGEKKYRLVWQQIHHRTLGTNKVPAEVWVDSLEDALALIGRTDEADTFRALVALTAEKEPALVGWLLRRPLQGLALGDDWRLLLAVVSWLREHPRPAIYLRQVDIEGVDSKFIEHHRRVLSELFDLVLPAESIDGAHRGITGFCRRYGFYDKPVRIRFRLLDPAIRLVADMADQDITVTGGGFATLGPPITDIFITENEINFLTFPPRPASMVIFGSGYGFDTLAAASWLHSRRIYYWGDIDTHGFAILDQLRAHFGAANSFLMDRRTLLSHAQFWGREPQPVKGELARLSRDEQAVYDDLRFDRLGERLRLEQERIRFSWVGQALDRL